MAFLWLWRQAASVRFRQLRRRQNYSIPAAQRYLRPTRGSVRVDGCDFGRMSSPELRGARRRIGTIYQQHNLVRSLTSFKTRFVAAWDVGRWHKLCAASSVWGNRCAGGDARARTRRPGGQATRAS